MSVSNILAVIAEATPEEYEEGFGWYEAAHTFAQGLSDRYHLPARQAAAIIAALSPQVSWERNLVLADTFCRTAECTGQTGANKDKARRLYEGEAPETVLRTPTSPHSGQKVRAFFDNIADPRHSEAVTIDRHAVAIALGRTMQDSERGRVLSRRGVYENVAQEYREAAALLNLRPLQAQAIAWIVWRNTEGLHYDTITKEGE